MEDDRDDCRTFAKPDALGVSVAGAACCRLVNNCSLREGIPAIHGAVWGSAEEAVIHAGRGANYE
jgi:hypothetical protein